MAYSAIRANLDWSQAALNPFGVPDICLKRWDNDVSNRFAILRMYMVPYFVSEIFSNCFPK